MAADGGDIPPDYSTLDFDRYQRVSFPREEDPRTRAATLNIAYELMLAEEDHYFSLETAWKYGFLSTSLEKITNHKWWKREQHHHRHTVGAADDIRVFHIRCTPAVVYNTILARDISDVNRAEWRTKINRVKISIVYVAGAGGAPRRLVCLRVKKERRFFTGIDHPHGFSFPLLTNEYGLCNNCHITLNSTKSKHIEHAMWASTGEGARAAAYEVMNLFQIQMLVPDRYLDLHDRNIATFRQRFLDRFLLFDPNGLPAAYEVVRRRLIQEFSTSLARAIEVAERVLSENVHDLVRVDATDRSESPSHVRLHDFALALATGNVGAAEEHADAIVFRVKRALKVNMQTHAGIGATTHASAWAKILQKYGNRHTACLWSFVNAAYFYVYNYGGVSGPTRANNPEAFTELWVRKFWESVVVANSNDGDTTAPNEPPCNVITVLRDCNYAAVVSVFASVVGRDYLQIIEDDPDAKPINRAFLSVRPVVDVVMAMLYGMERADAAEVARAAGVWQTLLPFTTEPRLVFEVVRPGSTALIRLMPSTCREMDSISLCGLLHPSDSIMRTLTVRDRMESILNHVRYAEKSVDYSDRAAVDRFKQTIAEFVEIVRGIMHRHYEAFNTVF